jgi:hypothetical protein
MTPIGKFRGHAPLLALAVCISAGATALGGEFRIAEVRSLGGANAGPIELHTIAFTDHRDEALADPSTGLIRFEDWARAMPVQKQFLSLYPSFVEPMVDLTEDGVTKPHKEKLHMYVAEARFILSKPAASIDLARYVTTAFLERMDPKIKHRMIAAADIDPAANRNPDREWCEAKARLLCIESRYELEGKLPSGIRVANQLVEKKKKIDDFLRFQSELRLLTPAELDQPGLARLTGIGAPIAGGIEQNIFFVNQVMQFGKFLAVLQPDAADAGKTQVSAFIALAIKSRILENKNKYASVPVLRNLVPGQVLVGKSSFNTGNSLSAGLPSYARNEIKAVAGILDQE